MSRKAKPGKKTKDWGSGSDGDSRNRGICSVRNSGEKLLVGKRHGKRGRRLALLTSQKEKRQVGKQRLLALKDL